MQFFLLAVTFGDTVTLVEYYKRCFPRISIKKIDKSFFAGFVRKMLIIFGDPDWIVLHCLLYFLQHKHPVFNCSDTVMSRPFPHSCEQRHQVARGLGGQNTVICMKLSTRVSTSFFYVCSLVWNVGKIC